MYVVTKGTSTLPFDLQCHHPINFLRATRKACIGSPLVNWSANWSFVLIPSMWISIFSTWMQKQWYRVAICFVCGVKFWHTCKFQACFIVFEYCRLWYEMRYRSDGISECLCMWVVRYFWFKFEDNTHNFLQNFSNGNQVSHGLTECDVLSFHCTQRDLHLHLWHPQQRRIAVSNHISSSRFRANRPPKSAST